MMDLENFVAETLRQIIKGVKMAQEHEDCNGAKINPIDPRPGHPDGPGVALKQIDFDVAVTVSEEGERQGRGSIGVASLFGIGGQSASTTANTLVSRIKFSVPVILPTKPPSRN